MPRVTNIETIFIILGAFCVTLLITGIILYIAVCTWVFASVTWEQFKDWCIAAYMRRQLR